MLRRLRSTLIRFSELSEHYWFGAWDGAAFLRFRRALAISSLIFFIRLYPILREGLTERGIHVSPSLLQGYYPLPLPLLSEGEFLGFYSLFLLSLLGILLQPRNRLIPTVAFLQLLYIMNADIIAAYVAYKLYLFAFLLLSLAPPPKEKGSFFPAWPIRTLQLTLLITYLGNGVIKAFYGDWMDHGNILKSAALGIYYGPITASFARFVPDVVWALAQHSALLCELLLPWALIFQSSRRCAVIAGLGLHLAIALLMQGLWPFSMTMACFYLAFLPLTPRQNGHAETSTSLHSRVAGVQ